MTTAQPQTIAANAAKGPAKRFRLGSITLTVWPNQDRSGKAYYTTTITRSFRTDKGWSDTGSLRPADLPIVVSLTTMAQDWLMAAEKQSSQEQLASDDAESVISLPQHELAR